MVSVARMRSPRGWLEPGQRPEFEEITLIVRGMVGVAASRCRAWQGSSWHRASGWAAPILVCQTRSALRQPSFPDDFSTPGLLRHGQLSLEGLGACYQTLKGELSCVLVGSLHRNARGS